MPYRRKSRVGAASMHMRDRMLMDLYLRVYREMLLRECRFVAQLTRSNTITPAVVRVANERVLLKLQKNFMAGVRE